MIFLIEGINWRKYSMTQEKGDISEQVKQLAKQAVVNPDPNAGILWPKYAEDTWRDPTVNHTSPSLETTKFDSDKFKKCVIPAFAPSATLGVSKTAAQSMAGNVAKAAASASELASMFVIGVAVDAAYCADQATVVLPPKVRRGYGR